MGLLSFIKDKLKRFDKSRGLNEGETISTPNVTNNLVFYDNSNKQTQTQDLFKRVEITQQYPFKGTVDFAIEQFISSLQYNYENFGKISPYSAVIAMSAIDNSFSGNNQANQNTFVSKARSRCIFKKYSRVYSKKRW